jgi:hypothetical protein
MAETRDTRPWWRKKTNIGLALIGIGGSVKAVSYFQTEPARLALDALSVTLVTLGNALAGYGIADRVGKK